MQDVLITGGAGFIGFHLARALAPGVRRLILCDNLDRGQLDDDLQVFLQQNRHVTFLTGDLLEPETYRRLGEGYDVAFHLAAIVGVEIVERDPVRVIRTNLLSCLQVLDWFARGGARRLVFSSTSEVYAGGAAFGILPVPTAETVPAVVADIAHPRSSYAISKLAGEHLVAQYGRQYSRDFTIVRYHNVYGPRMGMEHVIPQMMRRLVSGEDPFVVRSPGHTRAFCYVDDAVAATVALAGQPESSGLTVHVGNEQEEVPIIELAKYLTDVTTIRPQLLAGLDQTGSVSRRCPDTTLLRRLTGLTPAVPLTEGLRRTFAWYRPHLAR